MRKIAILSDIHANLPALESVIADARDQGTHEFWGLGDVMGYGPFVNETIDRLFEICSCQVVGNYDLKVLKFTKKQEKWKRTKHPEKYLAFEWAWQNLAQDNAVRLKDLPENIQLEVEGVSFLLTHGGPDKNNELIMSDTPLRRLKKLSAMTTSKVILFGHTHSQFLKTVGDTAFINPGSVGRAKELPAKACYAMLEISSGEFEVKFRKVDYDVQKLVETVRAKGLPESFAEMFTTGENVVKAKDDKFKSQDNKPKRRKTLSEIKSFAQKCYYEQGHSLQVLKLSKILFRKLKPVHGLGDDEKYLLVSAAILHDIGWLSGQAGHHKTSMKMILDDDTMPLDDSQRTIVALIARYHRKSLPKPTHSVYQDISPDQQKKVELLAGILRIADGLDRSHTSAVNKLDIAINNDCIEIHCGIEDEESAEIFAANKKSDLFKKVSGYNVKFYAENKAGTSS